MLFAAEQRPLQFINESSFVILHQDSKYFWSNTSFTKRKPSAFFRRSYNIAQILVLTRYLDLIWFILICLQYKKETEYQAMEISNILWNVTS